MQANQIEQIEDYFDKAQDQRFYSLLFMGLGGVIWAYNILMLFRPQRITMLRSGKKFGKI
jgi:hypothetical protein